MDAQAGTDHDDPVVHLGTAPLVCELEMDWDEVIGVFMTLRL